MTENYLTWNIVNWITVVLMVTIGLVVVTAGVSIVKRTLPAGS